MIGYYTTAGTLGALPATWQVLPLQPGSSPPGRRLLSWRAAFILTGPIL